MQALNQIKGAASSIQTRNWSEQLADGVEDALRRGQEVRVAVHSEAQVDLGRRTAKRLAGTIGGDAYKITFELIPQHEHDIYPIGAILI